jgi:YesN/AraC family two-component response regulator
MQNIINKNHIINSLYLTLLYTEHREVGVWWNYKKVMSPFSRMYLIPEGEGWVYQNKQEFHLTAGDLLLIPSFTEHSYRCDRSMDHYYICFFDKIQGAESIYNLYNFNCHQKATPADYQLMKRLLEINPNRQLPDTDPQKYDNKPALQSTYIQSVQNVEQIVESNGIMLQLFSRFIGQQKKIFESDTESYKRLNKVLTYINNNLSSKFTLEDLAAQVYLSPEYFSKLFKRIIGLKPTEYILRKRIEKAQILMISTTLNYSEIAFDVGIQNIPYFFTCFKKLTNMTPYEYRQNAWIIAPIEI